MRRRELSPRRQEYEAAFPVVTARIPAAVKEKLAKVLRVEDLSFSEWVQARVAGSGAQATAAYQRGRAEGEKAGEAEGYRRGRAEGEQVAGIAGFRAGLLTAAFAADHDRHYPREGVAQRLVEHPDQRAIAERLIPADYVADWRRTVGAVTSRQA
jgi:hypothetical protein